MIDDFVTMRLDLSLLCCAGYGNSRQPDTQVCARVRTKRLDEDEDEDDRLPCLTLGLPESTPFGPIVRADSGKFNNGIPHGSTSSLKAEEGEAVEVGSVRKRYTFEEEDEGSPRKKLRLSKQQTSVLEEYFNANTTLNGRQKQVLANKLNLRPRQVEVWFQNRRARTKLKQTEVDRELLRKCCETLKEDNARLKMELQRLKSTNLDDTEEPSISIVSFCPSCEISFPSQFSSPIDGGT